MSAAEVDTTIANSDVLSKYKAAGEISNRVLEQVKALTVEGAKIIDICVKGDELILAETENIYKGKKISKGIAFPTSISPNNVVAHLSPSPSDPEAEITLKAGDVVKITLGAQIDGYAASVADTIVIGGEISSRVADVITGAWYAAEAALRTIKPGNKNWDVTKIVDAVVKDYGVVALEGMLSHQQLQNVVDGKKEIILNPNENQKRDFETHTFEEGEVYGVDILVSTGEGKVRPGETTTSIFKKNNTTYQLKLQTSRATISEVQKKAGTFPFTIRSLSDPRKARMGLKEAITHSLVTPYDVVYEKSGEVVVQFFATIGLTKNGTVKFAGPVAPNFDVIKSDKKITNEEIVQLLSKPLKPANRKRNKKAAVEASA
ncbi:hypothetical protein DV495_004876 [Geotrichum candidum]|nr:hypothetical protein DV454_005205 [Geotrichum candidum]KAF5118805.1 hypothetical protein DV495_004876 [Geotrichum candidum]KAI8131419.1 hypothetical protein DUD61_004926 [Geotrichum candidum]